MPRTMRFFLFLLLFVSIILLSYSESFAVVPYPSTTEEGTEVQTPARQIDELKVRFRKHIQEQDQSFDVIRSKLLQIEKRDIATTKENIFLKLVTIVLLIFNFILLAWLLRDFRN